MNDDKSNEVFDNTTLEPKHKRSKRFEFTELKPGEIVEVCCCDASATCVFSECGVVENNGIKGRYNFYSPEQIDDCYTYIIKEGVFES